MNLRASTSLLAFAALSACASVPDEGMITAPAPLEIQILALNDFHGNLEAPGSPTTYNDAGEMKREALGGAAQMGAALQRLRQGQAHTITVAAGDLIGASPFVSANFLDEPSIVALSGMGLEIASVGNHEFDRGVDELRRMQYGGCAQYTSRTPCALEDFAGAAFDYLAGNVVNAADEPVFPAATLRSFGPVDLGFIGLTLKDTGMLVSPSATEGYRFLEEAQAANRTARDLVEQGADGVVLLIHEGVRTDPYFNASGCPQMTGALLPILDALDPVISVVVSGHTHNAYACEIDARDGETRLLTSAGRYGTFVTDIRVTFDPASGELTDFRAHNIPVTQAEGEHADIASLVHRYAEAAAPIAARVVGEISPAQDQGVDCIDRPADDLVADAQLAASRRVVDEGVDIAFINSGGVRTNLSSAEDGIMTYGEIFAMQPFGNTLVVLEMTGAQIGEVLEQQLCGEETVSSCYSYLIPSATFSYGIDRSRPAGGRIVDMVIGGQAVDPQSLYQVSVNNFIARGGDGFSVFSQARAIGDGGLDVAALEAYLANGVQVPTCGRIRYSDELAT